MRVSSTTGIFVTHGLIFIQMKRLHFFCLLYEDHIKMVIRTFYQAFVIFFSTFEMPFMNIFYCFNLFPGPDVQSSNK